MRAHSPDAADSTAAAGAGSIDGPVSLDSLIHECRWVTWRYEPRGARGALVRMLYCDMHREGRVDDPRTWVPHDAAWAVRQQIGGADAGIGVMLGRVNGAWLAAVDLMSCRDPLTGRFMPWATIVLETLDTYVQIRPSGADAVAFLLIDPGDAGALRALLDSAGDSHVNPHDDARALLPAVELHIEKHCIDVAWQHASDDYPTILRSVPFIDLRRVIEEAAPALAMQPRNAREGYAADTTPACPTVEITCFTKSNGALTKRISIGADGQPHSDGSTCLMWEGTARRVQTDMYRLAELIEQFQSNEAFALGAMQPDLPDRVQIVTKKKLGNAPRRGIISRTMTYISYRPKEPALALLDFDAKGMPTPMAARLRDEGGFLPVLLTVLPPLADAGRLVRASTSSGLYRDDTHEGFIGSGGMHVFVVVLDGEDVERFLRTMHDRCWLAGWGWFIVGAAGQLLERSIVDRMVGAPERLVFEGAPVLDRPLAQDARSRRPQAVDGPALDTVTVCQPLRLFEQARLRELRAREAHLLRPASDKARAEYLQRQAGEMTKRTRCTPEQANRIVERQIGGILLPNVVLQFDNLELAGATVGDVLADPVRFEGETLADPLEGVSYGACKAKIMRQPDGLLWVNSFAHGRTRYELRFDAAAIRAALDKMPRDQPDQIVERFVKLTINADLDAVETETLRDLVAERARIGKRGIDAKLKMAKRANATCMAQEAQERRMTERYDRRPQVMAPAANGEWLPVMGLLNDVLGSSDAPEPPMRDLEGYMAEVRARRVSGLHTLTQAGSNQEETEKGPPCLHLSNCC